MGYKAPKEIHISASYEGGTGLLSQERYLRGWKQGWGLYEMLSERYKTGSRDMVDMKCAEVLEYIYVYIVALSSFE